MKFVINRLKTGESLDGRVEERLPGGELIINIGGDLIRVSNETSRSLRAGDPVTLVVKAIQPLRFQLVDRRDLREKGKLDVNI